MSNPWTLRVLILFLLLILLYIAAKNRNYKAIQNHYPKYFFSVLLVMLIILLQILLLAMAGFDYAKYERALNAVFPLWILTVLIFFLMLIILSLPARGSPSLIEGTAAARNNSMSNMIIRACYFAGIYCLSFLHFRNLVFTDEKTTIKVHISFAQKLALSGTKVLPHEGFFQCLVLMNKFLGLSFEYSAIVLLSLALTACAIIVYLILKPLFREEYSDASLLAMTTILLTVSAIYVPFFNRYIYQGQGGPNVIHNSTLVMLKPFAIVGFFMISHFFEEKDRRQSLSYCIFTAIVLLMSVYIKPTFLLVLIPAAALYMLLKHPKEFNVYWKMFGILLPSCLLLCYQLQMHTVSMQRDIGFSFLAVWSLYSPSVPVSILITIAFPLSVLIFRFRSALRKNYVVISWLMTISGILQFALLAETTRTGEMFPSANWIGGYLIALTLLFISTGIEFLEWVRTARTAGTAEKLAMSISSTLLVLHTFSGILYFIRLYSIGTFKV